MHHLLLTLWKEEASYQFLAWVRRCALGLSVIVISSSSFWERRKTVSSLVTLVKKQVCRLGATNSSQMLYLSARNLIRDEVPLHLLSCPHQFSVHHQYPLSMTIPEITQTWLWEDGLNPHQTASDCWPNCFTDDSRNYALGKSISTVSSVSFCHQLLSQTSPRPPPFLPLEWRSKISLIACWPSLEPGSWQRGSLESLHLHSASLTEDWLNRGPHVLKGP